MNNTEPDDSSAFIVLHKYFENPKVFKGPCPSLNPQKPFKFYAALFVWFESDIIEATIKNLFAEGCERVYFIDNGSPDDTVAQAVKAGGIHWGTVHSEKFSEKLKTDSVMNMVQDVSEADECDRIWWMLPDADEFPTAPYEQTIFDYLCTLDDEIRCVGSLWLNHVPAYNPFYIPGFHPNEFQPEVSIKHDRAIPYCVQDHAKHNLIRQDRGKPFIYSTGGFHQFKCEDEIFEPASNLWLHHFHWRAPDFSKKRIEALVAPDKNGEGRIGDRKFYEDIKRGLKPHYLFYFNRLRRYKKVYKRDKHPELYADEPIGFWKSILDDGSAKATTLATWYSEKELVDAVAAVCSEEEFVNWRCINLASNHKWALFLDFFNKHQGQVEFREFVYKNCIEALLMDEHFNLSKALELAAEMRSLYPESEYAKKMFTQLCARVKNGSCAP